jgi:hypothetical protein
MCRIRDNSRLGRGLNVQVFDDNRLTFAWRCPESNARFVVAASLTSGAIICAIGGRRPALRVVNSSDYFVGTRCFSSSSNGWTTIIWRSLPVASLPRPLSSGTAGRFQLQTLSALGE